MSNLEKMRKLLLLITLGASSFSVLALDESNDLIDAFKKGQTQLEFRLRHEESRQKGLKLARATTIRSDLSFTTAEYHNVKLALGLVDVTSIFKKKYNPGLSSISNQQYAKIYDPVGTGLTQANLMFNAIPDTTITLGRQYITLDNERFIGKDDFRQFPQNFDAITFDTKALRNLEIFYSFIIYVNTTSANALALDALPQNTNIPIATNLYFESGRRRLRTHLANINWSAFDYGNIGAYAYFNNDRTNNIDSNLTYGFRIYSTEQKNYKNINYLLELAKQNSKYNNPTRTHSYYWHLLFGKTLEYASAAIGWEHLGKNFTTPLGSLHDFNGIADVFHAQGFTSGLNDFYINFNTGNTYVSGEFSVHMFENTNRTSTKKLLGYEYDATLELHCTQNITLSASYAYFRSKTPSYPTTNNFWLMLSAKLL
jgi:hypothetical protein